MNQDDPRYRIIEKYARQMVEKRFDMLPSVLFTRILDACGNVDEVLELVGSNRRECPYCGEEVEPAGQLSCNCKDDEDCHCADNEEHEWLCVSCGKDSIVTLEAYEELPLSGPWKVCWPAAHSYVFWTQDWKEPVHNDEIPLHCPGIVAAASESGFLVYESPDFEGHVLAIDGGGYDFYEAHWVPLYLALGLKWHEQDEEWKKEWSE